MFLVHLDAIQMPISLSLKHVLIKVYSFLTVNNTSYSHLCFSKGQEGSEREWTTRIFGLRTKDGWEGVEGRMSEEEEGTMRREERGMVRNDMRREWRDLRSEESSKEVSMEVGEIRGGRVIRGSGLRGKDDWRRGI